MSKQIILRVDQSFPTKISEHNFSIMVLFPPHQSPHCPSYIFVSEGVDKRVEAGCDYRIKEGNELALILRIFCWRLQVNAHYWNEEEGNNQKMGSTSPKHLLKSRGRRSHPQHDPSNGTIGTQDENKWDDNENGAHDHESQLICTSVNTG